MRTVILLTLTLAPLAAQQKMQLSGAVRGTEAFRKDIGHGLMFVIEPAPGDDSDDRGFVIQIQPAGQAQPDDYVRCVTLPAHGPTAADLPASEFVNGANEQLPETELAPLRTRELQFVLNTADQKKACDELDAELYGPQRVDPKTGAIVMGDPGYKGPPLGSAKVVLKNIELANLGKDKKAILKSLTFEVVIEFPTAGRKR
ncbi:MAG TPA: hypothetical protein VLY04_11155 [Bryobacteraceae bacterium]|nr:hypothetical protein [Bryobacteraceae bacterium]